MKKFLILILICFAQNIFSQNATSAGTKPDESPVYNTAGIDAKPEFPGGSDKFYAFVDENFKYPEGNINLKGKKIYVTFIVEKDGSLKTWAKEDAEFIKLRENADFKALAN